MTVSNQLNHVTAYLNNVTAICEDVDGGNRRRLKRRPAPRAGKEASAVAVCSTMPVPNQKDEWLRPEVQEALRLWRERDPKAARKWDAFARLQGQQDGAWARRRRKHQEDVAPGPTPAVKARRVAGQLTAVARGARSLMSAADVWIFDDASIHVVDTRPGLGRRLGPGRSVTMPAPTVYGSSLRPDWNRAEMAWVAAILHLDFYTVYRALKRVAPEREQLQPLLDGWPAFDQAPLLRELLAAGIGGDALIRELRQRTPRPRPPAELLPVISLAEHVGQGAHLIAAAMATLDLDDEERARRPAGAVRVADLPRAQQRWFLQRREQQILVRRIPALPQERGAKVDERSGAALADIFFAGHSLSRRMSRNADPPRRAVDVVDPAYLQILYRHGPDLAALTATGMMLDRSAATVRRLARDARVHGLVQRVNTQQGP